MIQRFNIMKNVIFTECLHSSRNETLYLIIVNVVIYNSAGEELNMKQNDILRNVNFHMKLSRPLRMTK